MYSRVENFCTALKPVFHVRRIDPETPGGRAKIKIQPRLEFIFGSHSQMALSVIVGFSVAYVLAYILPPISVTELVIAWGIVSQLSGECW